MPFARNVPMIPNLPAIRQTKPDTGRGNRSARGCGKRNDSEVARRMRDTPILGRLARGHRDANVSECRHSVYRLGEARDANPPRVRAKSGNRWYKIYKHNSN